MFIKRLFVTLLSVVCLLAVSLSAFACACCSERGTYDVWTGRADKYHLGLFKDIKFGKSAEMYITEAGFDNIKGLGPLQKEFDEGTLDELSLVDIYTNNTWQFTVKSPGGKTGTLTLPLPLKMTVVKIDTHEKSEEGKEITVYKEFQFKGPVGSGSGLFKSGIVRPTSYTLVFQGRGNNCDNAEDFSHWRLEVTGSKAKYAFFGKLNA